MMEMAEERPDPCVDLYHKQIRFLEDDIKKSELRCGELQKENKELICHRHIMEEDRNDVTEYLLHAIPVKEEEEQEVLGLLEHHRLERQKEDEALKLQHSQKMEELQEEAEKLLSEVEVLLQQKEHVREMKEQVAVVESLEEKKRIQAEKHKAELESLHLKLHSETVRKIQDVIDREVSARKQEKKFEASQLVKEVQSLKEEMARRVEERDSLLYAKRELQYNLENTCKHLTRLTGNIFQLNEESNQLAKKCEKLEAKLKHGRTRLQKALDMEEPLREQLSSKSEQLRQVTNESQQMYMELRSERDTIVQLEATMRRAAAVLRATVADSQDQEDIPRRLQRVLRILEGTHPGGAPPTLDNSAEESSQGLTPETSSPRTARAESPDFSTNPYFLMDCYRSGDFGFVPRPEWDPYTSRRQRTAPLEDFSDD